MKVVAGVLLNFTVCLDRTFPPATVLKASAEGVATSAPVVEGGVTVTMAVIVTAPDGPVTVILP